LVLPRELQLISLGASPSTTVVASAGAPVTAVESSRPAPDVFEGREFDLLDGAPGAALADQLGLVEPVDGLGEGVIECS
jgi:predicted glycoside hydrolase/deacetylase ChbG (UPF0249 family)